MHIVYLVCVEFTLREHRSRISSVRQFDSSRKVKKIPYCRRIDKLMMHFA